MISRNMAGAHRDTRKDHLCLGCSLSIVLRIPLSRHGLGQEDAVTGLNNSATPFLEARDPLRSSADGLMVCSFIVWNYMVD